MLFSEWLQNNSSLWGAIKSINSFPFIDEITPATLDNMEMVNYGDRSLFRKFETVQADIIAKQIVALYKKKWTDLIAIDQLDFHLGAKESHKGTVKVGNNEKKVIVKEDINSVSAYNSQDLIKDSATDGTETDTTTGDSTTESNDDIIALDALYNNLSLADKTAIINIVLKDVSNYMTLSVY